MRATLCGAAVLAALLLVFGPAFAEGVGFFDVKPGTVLDKFGLPMTAEEARARVTFHPFVPATNYTEVALLPAFHGDDKDNPQNRGIGFEYPVNGTFYVLREWPRAGGSIDKYPAYAGPRHCPHGFFTLGTPRYPRAVAWETTSMVYVLQPDIPWGTNPNLRSLRSEWERLARRGVCH